MSDNQTTTTQQPEPRSNVQANAFRRKVRPYCPVTEYQPFGSKRVGLSKENSVSKLVHEIPYSLTPEQATLLSKRFPTLEFVSTGYVGHDHPIAHTSAKITWDHVLSKLPAGTKAADINGNPLVNAQFNARSRGARVAPTIDTFCQVLCPKDAVRAKTRWGPKRVGDVDRWESMTLYDMYRNEENIKRFSKYDVFLMNHTIYYYTKNEIVRLLKMNPDAVLYASMHKLPGQNGTINCGEQSYVKNPITGKVVQTNVDTGETYEHLDTSPWFESYQYADADGAIAWTCNKVCEDHYIMTITSCPPELVEQKYWLNQTMYTQGVVVAVPDQVEARPPAYSVLEVTIDGNKMCPGLRGKSKRVKISHPKLYEDLQSFMINRPRNISTLKDLTAKAHREVGNNMLLGKGGKRIEISPAALTEHIAAAFVGNCALERTLWQQVLPNSENPLRGEYSAVAKGALRVILAGRAVFGSKDPVDKVLHLLDDLF